MLDFSLTEEQRLLVETLRRFIREELCPHEERVELEGLVAPEVAAELRAKAIELGLFALNMPAEVGGAGLGAVDMCLCEEEFGFTKDALVRRAFGSVPSSLLNCNQMQRERYLLPAVRGDLNVGVAMTEPEAGSDAAGIKTMARADGENFILTGSKHFISDADVADCFIVTAVTETDKGARGISAFLVNRDMPGFRVGRIQPMMGLHGTNHGELVFEGIRLPRDAMLGDEGSGLFQALSTINRVRLGKVGARSVGMARRLLELSLSHARERRQFGRAIGEFQLVQAMLADTTSEIFAARMMVLSTAWDIDQGLDPRDKISMVKLFASEMLGRAADRAVQVFGGMGYCADMPVERLYRDARVYRIFDGASEIHRGIIGRSLMRNGSDALWSMFGPA